MEYTFLTYVSFWYSKISARSSKRPKTLEKQMLQLTLLSQKMDGSVHYHRIQYRYSTEWQHCNGKWGYAHSTRSLSALKRSQNPVTAILIEGTILFRNCKLILSIQFIYYDIFWVLQKTLTLCCCFLIGLGTISSTPDKLLTITDHPTDGYFYRINRSQLLDYAIAVSGFRPIE